MKQAVTVAFWFSLMSLITSSLEVKSVEQKEWQKLNEDGMKAAQSGKMSEARRLFESALKHSETQASTEQRALLLNNLGFVDLDLSDYSAAEPLLIASIEAFRQSGRQSSIDSVNTMENLGRLYWRMGQFDKAAPWLVKSLAMQKKTPGLSHEFVAVRLENIGEFYSQQGALQQSEAALREASLLREKFEDAQSGLSNTYEKLANVLLSQHKDVQAKGVLEQALACARQTFGSESKQAKTIQIRMTDPEDKTRPELTIIRPRPGEIFKDEPIVARVNVGNFELRQPEPMFGKAPGTKVGHIHYLLDNHPPIATNAIQIMIEGGPAFLSAGEHTLWMELVDETHNPLVPPVRRRVKFQTQH